MAARGAIPPHVRTYVALHALGAVALAVAAHEVLARWQPAAVRIVALTASAAVILAGVASASTRREWRDAYPRDVAAVNAFLGNRGNRDGLLTDWMWWREWTVGVYGTDPGGDVSNYVLCSRGTNRIPPASVTAGRSAIEVERLTRAWQFVDAAPPRFVAMFNDDAYVNWRAWEQRADPEVLSSFVRPLLSLSGGCFVTVDGLPRARYCPVLSTGRFTVLEREP
jgi:hypothetical protein